jgi:hypothetical protein
MSQWNEIIDSVINICSPETYHEFVEGVGDVMEEGGLAAYYHASPLLLLTVGMYREVMARPDADLSPIAEGLERLWQTVIDDRDTSTLNTDEAEEEDEYLLDELEFLRHETDGLLAIFEAYAAGQGSPADDANGLIQQSTLLISSNHHKARRQFGQAGAAILRGANYWPLWPHEIDIPPVSGWLRGLSGLITFFKLESLYPLAPLAEQRQKFSQTEAARPKPAPSEGQEEPFEETLSADEERLMKVLLCGKEKLSDKQIASLPPFTPEIVSRLRLVVHSNLYDTEDSEGKGYAPIHAAKLLGQTGSPEAVEPLIYALYRSDPDEILYSEAIFALEALGPLALPGVLDSMQYSDNPDFKLGLAGTLATIGRDDERAFRALEAYYHETTWEDDRVMAVSDLGKLGDSRALPLLHKALNDRDITPMGINEVIGAIEELDPNHNPDELKRLETKARQRYDSRLVRFDKHGKAFCRNCGSLMEKDMFGEWQHVEPEAPLPGRGARPALPAFDPFPPPVDPRYKNVGRNDPCPCGSGKKFKHCHGSGKMTVN